MRRRRYLITYDISDDKRRDGVFKMLRDQGDHAQYSVFLCELTPQELALLRAELSERIHMREDQVLILDLGLAKAPLGAALESLGKSYDPPLRALVV